jgi:hypothetical protein
MKDHAKGWRLLVLAALAAAPAAILSATGCEPAATRRLTIVLVEYRGPEASASARRLGSDLVAQGLRDIFLVEGDEYASVCIGHYESWKDAQADAMLKRVRVIRDAQGQFPFAGVMLMPIPEPMPKNPWPLEGAKGLFTLHVASWEAPGRMVNAARYASSLRSSGLEAYVYHGPRLSMVTIGAFGLDIFDDPGKVGQPNAKPKIVDPKVLGLIKRFPRMRLEGQETPPEAHVPTQLVKVPGKEPLTAPGMSPPKVLYRITLALVDPRTGVAEGRKQATGVAQGKRQVPTLVGVLVKQLMAGLAENKTPRIGTVGVAGDAAAAKDGVDAMVIEALGAALKAAGGGKIRLFSQEGTRQILDAVGVKADAYAQHPGPIANFEGLDLLLVGSVKAF